MIENLMEKRVTRFTLLEKLRSRRLEAMPVSQNQEKPIFEKKNEMTKKAFIPPLVKEWLEICLHEGHTEPSQPKVGKCIGWPQRSFFKESLFADLTCFCLKRGIPHIPSEMAFYAVLDQIFDSDSHGRYVFPSLDVCRIRYSKLLEVDQRENR